VATLGHWLTDLSTANAIALATGIVAAFALLVAAWNAWIAVVNERRRSQPVVIAHEAHRRRFSDDPLVSAFVVGAFVTNEGDGPAFNVRFGVAFRGVRYPYKLRVEDPDSGNVQRVVRSGQQIPPGGYWPILIDLTRMMSGTGEGDPDPGRIYWARYENARGQVWETRNPGDRSAKLDIRRVRSIRWHEWREGRMRRKASKRGVEWERKALAELQRGFEENRAADAKRKAEEDSVDE
jgi:hypothetical protein